MKWVLIGIALLVVLAALVTLIVIVGRRSYQSYSGKESQRAQGKRARDAAFERMKEAERDLMRAQRALIDHRRLQDATAVEVLRRRITAAADRHRYTGYGYAPVASDRPVQEAELAALQTRDTELIADCEQVAALSREVAGSADSARSGESVDLTKLTDAVVNVDTALAARKVAL